MSTHFLRSRDIVHRLCIAGLVARLSGCLVPLPYPIPGSSICLLFLGCFLREQGGGGCLVHRDRFGREGKGVTKVYMGGMMEGGPGALYICGTER